MGYNLRTYSELHFVVLLLGFTGILGKLITLPAPELVVFRIFFAFISLLIILKIQKVNLKASRKMIFSALSNLAEETKKYFTVMQVTAGDMV